MNFGIAFLGDRLSAAEHDWRANRLSAFGAAWDAYKFLFRHFWSALRLLFLPIIAAGVVLYVTLNRYLTELLSFLNAPDPRTASLGLGTLAAGTFLSLFCYAIAVSAICDLALGKPPRRTWLHFKAERQAWRLYAAYLRLLLLLSVVFATAFVLSTYVAPRIFVPASISSWMLALVSGLGGFWLFARIGFLVAPVVAVSQGPVVRNAINQSAGDLLRNSLLLALLLVPGVLLLLAGGYVFGMKAAALQGGGTLPLADSARSMKEMLGAFVTVISLALLVTIALLTVGAIAAYQTKRFRQAWDGRAAQPATGSNLGCSAPDETLPR